MMKLRYMAIFGLVAALLSGCGGEKASAPGAEPLAEGSFLLPLQPRDSVLIADQLRYGFHLSDRELDGTLEPLPERPEMPGVRLVSEEWQIDATAVPGKPGRYDIDAYVVVTSFDEGSYELPPLGAVIDGDTLSFDSRTLTVWNCPVDTTKFAPDALYIPSTDPVRFPWSSAAKWRFAGILGVGLLLIAGLCFLLWWLIVRRGRKAVEAPEEPAHIRALRKIDGYRGDQYWQPARQKEFYSGITDALKEYIGDRYGFDAPEMTSGEVLHALKKDTDLDAELRKKLGHLFEVADFVKFAKHTVDDTENASVVPFATSFVTTTWQQALEQEAEDKKKEAAQ